MGPEFLPVFYRRLTDSAALRWNHGGLFIIAPFAMNAPRTVSQASLLQLRDARACPVSTGSQRALQHAEKALWRMVSYYGDALQDIDAALGEDPHWSLAHVIKANLLLTLAEQPFAHMAAECLQAAKVHATQANARERAHIGATQACLDGDWQRACALWEALLVEHPQDIFALLCAHLFDFYRGDQQNLRRRVARVLPDWSRDMPLYSHVLGMYAFGLEESNLYAQAEEVGREALALNPMDPWAVHAVAHVFEMQGRHEQGAHWLQSRQDDWAPDNGFAFHNWWHLALFQLERLDTDAVLSLYDRHIAGPWDMALQRVDATAMLWRLRLLGVDVGDRWRAVAAAWAVDAPSAGFYAFNDFHALLAQIGAAEPGRAAKVLQAAEAATSGGPSNRAMVDQLASPLMRGFAAAADGRHDQACDLLLPLRDTTHLFGGSHAQRDLIALTLLDSSIQAGRPALARHLLNERRMAKPESPLTQHWMRRAS